MELSREAKLYIAHAQAGAANEITRVRGQRGKAKKKKKREEERNAEKKIAEPTREQQGGQTQNACKWLAPCVFSFKGIP